MTDETLLREINEHLEAALEADDPAEKNFHVRSALQKLSIEFEQPA